MENSDSLWLEREPSVEEVKAEFSKFDMNKYEEVVFCGFGEPTMRLDDMLEVMDFIKEKYKKPIRVNTNGLANLYYKKDVTPLFENRVDTVSISLNTPNPKRYYELTRNRFGLEGFDGLLDFAKKVKQYVPHVVFTTVDTTLSKDEEEQCKKICEDLGVTYRIRPWED
jgi:TatD family-associated radical SAM protein